MATSSPAGTSCEWFTLKLDTQDEISLKVCCVAFVVKAQKYFTGNMSHFVSLKAPKTFC